MKEKIKIRKIEGSFGQSSRRGERIQAYRASISSEVRFFAYPDTLDSASEHGKERAMCGLAEDIKDSCTQAMSAVHNGRYDKCVEHLQSVLDQFHAQIGFSAVSLDEIKALTNENT